MLYHCIHMRYLDVKLIETENEIEFIRGGREEVMGSYCLVGIKIELRIMKKL